MRTVAQARPPAQRHALARSTRRRLVLVQRLPAESWRCRRSGACARRPCNTTRCSTSCCLWSAPRRGWAQGTPSRHGDLTAIVARPRWIRQLSRLGRRHGLGTRRLRDLRLRAVRGDRQAGSRGAARCGGRPSSVRPDYRHSPRCGVRGGIAVSRAGSRHPWSASAPSSCVGLSVQFDPRRDLALAGLADHRGRRRHRAKSRSGHVLSVPARSVDRAADLPAGLTAAVLGALGCQPPRAAGWVQRPRQPRWQDSSRRRRRSASSAPPGSTRTA